MQTAQVFFAREIRRIDQVIEQVSGVIDAEPSANGRHAGMRALLDVQCHHRRIVEALAAQSDDLEDALHACRARMIAVGATHQRIAAQGGARNLQSADAWWQTLNELEYLASLSSQLQQLVHANGKSADTALGPEHDDDWSPR